MKSFFRILVCISSAYCYGAETFFPVSEHGGNTTISKFEEEWYSKHLQIMGEPSLFAKNGLNQNEIYRFTLLPTWGDPRSVTVTAKGKNAHIRFRRLDGDGGYDPGKLVEQEQRELLPEEFKQFQTMFQALDFMREPTRDPVMGLDGSQWILEMLKDGKYHILVRWTPDAYDPKKRGTVSFVKFCEWMLKNAPREKQPKDDRAP